MENMAPTPDQAPAMVEAMLSSWLTDQSRRRLHGRGAAVDAGRDPGAFPRTATASSISRHAPFRLLAIANRIDLQNVSGGSAGEGRFVFGSSTSSAIRCR